MPLDVGIPETADPASAALGIRVLQIGRGRCVARMAVGPAMVNSLGTCHGGVVFTLADSACGLACNYAAPAAVAAAATIDFLAPARIGDELTATANECWREGRGAVYDAVVTNQNGQTVALLRGRARQLRETGVAAEIP